MRRLLTVAMATAALMLPAGAAHAAAGTVADAAAGTVAPVLVLDGGHVHVTREPFLGPTALPAPRARVRATAGAAGKRAGAAAAKKAPRGRATRLAIDD